MFIPLDEEQFVATLPPICRLRGGVVESPRLATSLETDLVF
jgi:hypothetical protein